VTVFPFCSPLRFSTTTHYFAEENILHAGQACIDDVPKHTGWDWSKQRDHPDTVKDELGLRCLNPDDEATCPKARLCKDGSICHEDRPQWHLDSVLEQPPPLGLGIKAKPYLNPLDGDLLKETFDGLPATYEYHLQAGSWAIVPPNYRVEFDG
jgi:hypothetical protein